MNRKRKVAPEERVAVAKVKGKPFLVPPRPGGEQNARFIRGLITAFAIEIAAALLIWAGISIWSAYARHYGSGQHSTHSAEARFINPPHGSLI